MRRLAKWLFLAVPIVLLGCESRQTGICEKDSHCEGAQICFEGKCMTVKQRDEILEQRKQDAKPKVCQDKDGDGVRAGNGCPAGEGLGVVGTLAGVSDTKLGVGGYQDGPAPSARFSYPHGITMDAQGNIVVADTGNSVIRLVTASGQVKTIYGRPGESRAQDGPVAQARFRTPTDIATGPDGSLFVVDTEANRVRWIVP